MSRHQFRHWAAALSAGFSQGLDGLAVRLAIQAHLPALAVAVQPASPLKSAASASRATSLTGVQA
jgi:hypothetical protein